MESSSINGMCRCCASEGAFKDIKTSYHWMGEEEVYGDMLRECFDVNLSSADQGGVCEVCITQLRNASNFKKQVLHTEVQFKQHMRSKGFKAAQVKEEMSGYEDNDSDDMDNVDDEDYVPDYEVPIKTESESEDKPKKRTAKAATTRAKKSKSSDADAAVKNIGCGKSNIKKCIEESSPVKKFQPVRNLNKISDPDWKVTIVKKSSTQIIPVESWKISEKNISKGSGNSFQSSVNKKTVSNDTLQSDKEFKKHLHNLKTILLNSNATPIRTQNHRGYKCSLCACHYRDMDRLKLHTRNKHSDLEKGNFMESSTMSDFIVMLDITKLQCSLCQKRIDSLDLLVEHLNTTHEKQMFTDINNHILPIKNKDDVFICAVCNDSFENFKIIKGHMNVHFKNYPCEVCNLEAFVCKRNYYYHMETHKLDRFKCDFCPKVFDKHKQLRCHEIRHVTDRKRYKCPHCKERFFKYVDEVKHIKEDHGLEPQVLQCMACDRTFGTEYALNIHTKRDHLMERPFKCQQCDKSFFSAGFLKNHMLKHTGEKNYECDICLKKYGRKGFLREHMRIHIDDRRFKCDVCNLSFIQKGSWKGHMRSKHFKIVQ